jgi:DNA repair photolyase
MKKMKIKKIQCQSTIGKCGFPGGGWAINPYIGCGHNCLYCYARFIKRFTGRKEKWGSFADVRTNIDEVLKKQIKSERYRKGQIFISTVTDPYQPIEKKYRLTRKILEVLKEEKVNISILTKSDLVLRDLDILKEMKNVDVNFTINTLDEKFKKIVEPNSSSIKERLEAAEKLKKEGISVFVMMGPYWPIFTRPDGLFKKFKEIRISRVFSESFNTIGGNWYGVEKAIRAVYPKELEEIKEILFDKEKFRLFYNQARKEIENASRKYKIPATIYFGKGHGAKFKTIT